MLEYMAMIAVFAIFAGMGVVTRKAYKGES